ncbi:ABC transporter permease [candidate division WOR-3 bacterium]|nr:ABC transporter permease [candidate division WOR-3 bacterium]
MKFLVHTKTALLALKSQRMRTFLTTLGIIIGVMTVITMTSIVQGMNRYVYKVLGTIGSNVIYAQKYQWRVMGGHMSRKEYREIAKRKDFTEEDVKAISKLPSIERVTFAQSTWGRGRKIAYRSEEIEINQIEGATPDYMIISNYEIERGRTFIETDLSFRRQVCIVGTYIVENLFKKGEDPIGKDVYIGSYKFEIIGVLTERGNFMGNNLDNTLIIPLATLSKFVGSARGWYSAYESPFIVAQTREAFPIEEAQEQMEELLRQRRGNRFNEENDFALNTQQMIVDIYKKITSGIYTSMIGIASLALIVGGIGIMNIMLVSVIERTREIGLRMAIGAKRRDIMVQFLIEAVVLTGAGGAMGVLLGFGLSKLIAAFTPLPASTPFWSVALGIGFSVIIGLFFGIYPASKAAKLDPIRALQYE